MTRKALLTGSILTAALLLGALAWMNRKSAVDTAFTPLELPRKTPEQRAMMIEARWQYEYDMLKDPRTGLIPRGIDERARAMAKRLPLAKRRLKASQVEVRGPSNIGGRTRAIAIDLADPSSNTILAGGVNGGMFRTVDGGQSWTRVTPDGAIHSVTAIAQDPASPNVWYYGTGEVQGTASLGTFLPGNGIWKSQDGGLTWSQLPATASPIGETFDFFFDLVHRLAVDPATGDVYAAVHRSVFRSQDGGSSWTPVLTTQTASSGVAGTTDIAIDSTGSRFYAAFHGSATNQMGGVWTSTSGDANSWTKIAGPGAELNPADWNATPGRIVLAIAPSQENLLYALYDNNHVNDCDDDSEEKPEADLFLFDAAAQAWTNLSANLPDDPGCSQGNDPLAVQGGYNMALAVSPLDSDTVVVGGTNLYVSRNGFRIADAVRIGGYRSANNYGAFPNHHPDIHELRFDPFDPSALFCGSDGGVHRTNLNQVSWQSLNNGYITLQYYHAAIAPHPGDDRVIGGTQDNGTTLSRSGAFHSSVSGGDGVAVGIAADRLEDGQTVEHYYVGVQLGQIFRLRSGGGFANIKPAGTGQGMFVTYFLLDPDNTDILYYANGNRLFRTLTARSVSPGTWTELTALGAIIGDNVNIQSMAVTRGSYTAESKLYIGDSGGRIFRLVNPAAAEAAALPEEITPPQSLSGAMISGIAVDPLDDDIVMAVSPNYGAPSIFVTFDGGQTWDQVEGNLALPSIRSAAIAHTEGGRVFLVGTSVGLWSARALSGAATAWRREAADAIGLSIVSALALRPTDNRLLAATHGNGMFTLDLQDDDSGPVYAAVTHLPDVQTGADGADTLIGLVNPNANESVAVDLLAYDADGELLAVSEIVGALSGRGAVQLNASDAFPDHLGRVARVEAGSDGPLWAFADLRRGGTASAAYRAPSRSARAFMPHIAVDRVNFETLLSVANDEPGELSFSVTLQPGDAEFAAIAPGQGRFQRQARQIFGAALDGLPAAWAVLDAPVQPSLAAVERFARLPGRSQEAALDLNADFGPDLFFLHVAEDTARFWTGMVYANIENQEAAITETYYDRDGAVLKTFEHALAPREKTTILFDAANQDRAPVGTAWVHVRANRALVGYELFGAPVDSGGDYFAGLQGVYDSGNTLNYPYYHRGANAFTGLVAVNLGSQTADIVFAAIDASGAVLENARVRGIAPKTKLSILARDLFQTQVARDNAVWVRAATTGSEWAGFMLWGDDAEPRQTLAGINATVE